MASDQARDLRQRGIAAAKAGQRDEARALLQQSIRLDPRSEAAWLWLASVARDPEERRFSLEKLLEINPNNETALKALGGSPADASPIRRIGGEGTKRTTGTNELPAIGQPAAGANTPTSVPIPPADKIADAQRQVDALVREIDLSLPQNVKYVHKTKRRAGEGDIVVYRLYLTIGVVGALALVGLIFGIILATNEDAQEVVFGPSATPTTTPTITWTPTPGFTPTPSAEPRNSLTPSPTVPPEIVGADIYNLPRPTPFNPPLLDRAVDNAVAALYRGDARLALPTLEAARELTVDARFDAVPYYYESAALIQRGDLNQALSLLEEAEERRDEEAPADNQAQAIIDAGYVQVYYALAENTNDAVRENELLGLMEERANSAIEGDETLAPPYLLLARRQRELGRYDEAIRTLNQGLAVPDLSGNTEFMLEKALIFYDQRELTLADYQAFLALYTDPTNESAHRLRVQLALDRDDYGDAVLRSQYYLLFYPGSRIGYQFLGDAHRLGGDQNLALEAYDRGLNSLDESEATFNMLVGRASIYASQRRYDLARDDLTQALGIREDVDVQLARMEAAYYAGSYQIAISDANDLASRAGGDAWRTQLIEARALIDQDREDVSALIRAQPLLEAAQVSAPAAQRATVNEYLAWVHLGQGDTETALETIDSAIRADDSAARRYIRGQILEASNDDEGALREYQWALTLSELVPYAGRGEIEDRIDALST